MFGGLAFHASLRRCAAPGCRTAHAPHLYRLPSLHPAAKMGLCGPRVISAAKAFSQSMAVLVSRSGSVGIDRQGAWKNVPVNLLSPWPLGASPHCVPSSWFSSVSSSSVSSSTPPLSPKPPAGRFRKTKLFASLALLSSALFLLQYWREQSTSSSSFSSSPLSTNTGEDSEEFELPATYSASAISVYFSKRPATVISRAAEIASALVPFLAVVAFQAGTGRFKAEDGQEMQQTRAKEMNLLLTRLGPCFVKLGQMLSIRPDLVPPVAIYELQKLCDSLPPFPTAQCRAIVAQQLGCDPNDVFEGLEEGAVPIATASLGQVYKCVLRATGEQVAVKVQRPDVKKCIMLDLFLLRRWASLVEMFKRNLTKQLPHDVALVDAFAEASCQELDYINEATNQEMFRRRLLPLMRDELHIPAVKWGATKRKVITTEWVDGVQLAKSPPDVIRRLVPAGVKCFLLQLLDLGFFHGDPHPGNLFVTKSGKLCLLDFGLCARLSVGNDAVGDRGDALTKAIVHAIHMDVPALLTDMVDLGFLEDMQAAAELREIVQEIFDRSQAFHQARGEMRKEPNEDVLQGRFVPSFTAAERRASFSVISKQLNQVFFDYPFTVPDYFALITRALIVLEGIALTGDPKFDIFRAAYPFAMQRALRSLDLRDVIGVASAVARAGAKSRLSI